MRFKGKKPLDICGSRKRTASTYFFIDYLIFLFYNYIKEKQERGVNMNLFTKEDSNEKTYYVTVIETLKKRVEVNATSEEDALEKVQSAYDKCDIILDENDFTDVKFKIKKVTDTNENEEE